MSNIFFTADTHFGHENIIKFCKRPFSSAEEMDEVLIENWNAKVGKEDLIYHLGDVTWYGSKQTKEIMSRLNGRKILIKGNHDKVKNLEPYFETIRNYDFLPYLKTRIILMHFPIESWDGQFHGSPHLHGHTHGNIDNSGLLRFDIGVDSFNYQPVCLDEIFALIPEREKQASEKDLGRIKKFKALYDRATK